MIHIRKWQDRRSRLVVLGPQIITQFFYYSSNMTKNPPFLSSPSTFFRVEAVAKFFEKLHTT